MRCSNPRCGKTLPRNIRNCPYCGSRITPSRARLGWRVDRSILRKAWLPALGMLTVGLVIVVSGHWAGRDGGPVKVINAPTVVATATPSPAGTAVEAALVQPTLEAITGRRSDATSTPVPASTRSTAAEPASPTTEATVERPTVTPTLSATPVRTPTPGLIVAAQPTSVPFPTATPIAVPADTAPGSLLEEAQVWRQGGWELSLVKVVYGGQSVCPEFRLTNGSSQQRDLTYSLQSFQAFDDRGRRLDVSSAGTCGQDASQYCEPGAKLVPAGGTITLDCGGTLELPMNKVKPSPTQVIITVSGISSINDARWRIPIAY